MIAALLALALAGPRPVDDATAGFPVEGRTTVTVHGGFPWLGTRVATGWTDRVSLVVDGRTALARRWEGGVGPGVHVVRGSAGRLGAVALLGAGGQGGELARSGPMAELRAIAAWTGPVDVVLTGVSRHLLDYRRVHRSTADGLEKEARFVPLWTRGAQLDLGASATDRLALTAGIDWLTVDGAFAIPGVHGAIHWSTP